MDVNTLVEDIEEHGEQVREILNRPPHWLISTGSTLVFIAVVFLFGLSFYIKYPDVLNARITITTPHPAVNLVAKSSGRIQHIFVRDNALLSKGEKIAILENAANADEVFLLKQTLKEIGLKNLGKIPRKLPPLTALGSVQNYYSDFLRKHAAYFSHLHLFSKNQKIRVLQTQVASFQQQLQNLQTQRHSLEDEVSLMQKSVDRNKVLFQNGVISAAEWEEKQREMLPLKRLLDNNAIAITNVMVEIERIRETMNDFNQNGDQSYANLSSNLIESYQNLHNAIKTWEQTFLLIAPINGRLSYFKFWSKNQFVKQGEEVFSLLPVEKQKNFGKIMLPTQNTGKLKLGQKVIIRLDNYPYTEFGVLEGSVKKISTLPKQNSYAVEITLPDQLTTNHGFSIKSPSEIQGDASIITEDLRLIDRLFYKLRRSITPTSNTTVVTNQ